MEFRVLEFRVEDVGSARGCSVKGAGLRVEG